MRMQKRQPPVSLSYKTIGTDDRAGYNRSLYRTESRFPGVPLSPTKEPRRSLLSWFRK